MGAPAETAVEEGGETWGGVDEVVVVVVCMCIRARTRGEGARAKKNRKPSHSGSVSGCFGAAGCREGCCGVVPPPSRINLACGGGE